MNTLKDILKEKVIILILYSSYQNELELISLRRILQIYLKEIYKIKFIEYYSYSHLLSILSIVDINIDPICDSDILVYSYSSFAKVPTIVYINDIIYSETTHITNIIGYNNLYYQNIFRITHNFEEYINQIKKLINNKDDLNYYKNDLHINRYLIYNDTSIIDELLPFFKLSMNKEIITNKKDIETIIENSFKYNNYDSCTITSFLLTQTNPTNSTIIKTIGECYYMLREYTCIIFIFIASYRKFKLSFFYNPKLQNNSLIYTKIYKIMNETKDINEWLGLYYKKPWQYQSFH